MAQEARMVSERNQTLRVIPGGGPPRATEGDGPRDSKGDWREGKPLEDPEKMKAWGLVCAKPSEYLIVLKNGQLNTRASGQGARIFKWPWQTVAIVPTTLQRIAFEADQVTQERVGVRVRGVAVYRIASPEVAYSVLNFSYGERASQKLEETLAQMFVGAARRLVANLTLEDCLSRRKESIATFLMEEIAPVVEGRGRGDDKAEGGWGVVIDTIEIQEVMIQSAQVFQDLQAPYRAQLRRQAALAALEEEREIAEARAGAARQTRLVRARAEAEAAEGEARDTLRAEEARLAAARDGLRREEELERQRQDMAEALALAEAESQARLRNRQAAIERDRALQALRSEEAERRLKAEVELAAIQAEAEVEARRGAERMDALARQRAEMLAAEQTQGERRRSGAALERELRREMVDVKRLEGQAQGEIAEAAARADKLRVEAVAMEVLLRETLPQVAHALGEGLGGAQITQIGGGDGAGEPFSQALAQVLGVARGFGLDLARLGRGATEGAEGSA